ncbi:MAG TPA: hypothetical protein VF132_04850 [Rudaea sp.]
MPMRALIAALVLVVSCSSASAGQTALGEGFDTLYRIDLDSRTAQAIGPSGVFGGNPIAVEGLAFAPDGKLYAVSDNLKLFLQINPQTGAATVIGSLGLAGQGTGQFDSLDMSMAFTCDGKAWIASAGTGKFWQVDPNSGATTYVGNLGVSITGLTARNGTLYGAGGRTSPSLYAINTANAQASVIGSFGIGSQWITFVSPGFDSSGKMWAVLDNVPPGPGVDTLPLWSDLATLGGNGTLTNLGNITGPAGLQKQGLKGLAFGPPACQSGNAGNPGLYTPTPALSSPFKVVLAILLALLAGTTLRRRRPK